MFDQADCELVSWRGGELVNEKDNGLELKQQKRQGPC